MNKYITKLNKTLENNYYIKAFLLGVFISFCFFIPFIIYDKGYFLYYGDFNVQQVPFYQLVHDAIKNGEFFWSFKTDLGANLIGSYSFYLLGSPFFWVTLPFKSSAVPYLMGPLLILKFGCASLTSYTYLKRYTKNQNIALIGALLYAFSGFSIYNIFFNHFHEAIIIFPLVLASLDEYMATKKRGFFALTIFASCLFNYYFFVGQVVFCIIYWFVKVICGNWKINMRDFLLLILEAFIGVGMCLFILLPTILAVIQNPRVDNPPNGWSSLLYNNEQRYLHIIQSFFFPPDIPARPNFTPKSEAKWASVAAWLPLFSMTGVITWLRIKKKNWLKTLLIILFFMSMVPILNSAFQGFNSSYYARWFYMLTLMMSLATVKSLNSDISNKEWKKSIFQTLFITLLIALPIGLIPKNTDEGTKIGLMEYKDRFWIYVAIALISLFILAILINFLKKKDKQVFFRATLASVILISVLYSIFIIGLGKSQSYDTHNFIIPYCLNQGKDIKLPDDKEYRIDIYNGMDNQAMFWQMPTIQAFHSIVPGSIMEFYPSLGVKRDVGSRPETKFYGIRALTSCRWVFDYTKDSNYFAGKDKNSPSMPGFEYYDTQNGFDIWENKYFIPYGFTYQNYITREQYNQISKEKRHLALLKAIVLEDESVNRNKDIINNESIDSFNYSQSSYFYDCVKLQESSCSEFKIGKSSFNAKYESKSNKDELVFFSIPYEKGWSAKVNGEPVQIEKVNIGFMAVRVPAGEISEIEFNYFTPGFKIGSISSLLFTILFIAYIFITRKLNIENKDNKIKIYKILKIEKTHN